MRADSTVVPLDTPLAVAKSLQCDFDVSIALQPWEFLSPLYQ